MKKIIVLLLIPKLNTMKNIVKSMFVVLCSMMITATFVACGGDDNDDNTGGGGGSGTSSGLTGWYIRQDLKGFWLDLVADDSTYEFNMQGEIIGVAHMWGSEQRENMSEGPGQEAYYIPDDETFIKYEGSYYKQNASAAQGKTLLYMFDYKNLGTLGLYAKYTYYYTYWREGNKLYTSEDGWTVYTITPSGIIPDGSSFVYSKYDPDIVY